MQKVADEGERKQEPYADGKPSGEDAAVSFNLLDSALS